MADFWTMTQNPSQPRYEPESSDKVQLLRIEERHDGQRLDNYLLRELKGVPRSRIYRLIRRGEFRVNKKRCKPEQRLNQGDLLRVPPIAVATRDSASPPGEGLQKLLRAALLHEEEDFLILNKPAGLAVHGGTGIRLGLVEALRQMAPEWQHLELAHRLDRDTSGCLALAKNPRYLKYLQDQFKARTVHKRYLALVLGEWPDALVEVRAPLRKNQLDSGARVVRVDPDGKPACSRMQVRERFADCTLIEVLPETGRTHQIRVHCQASGHPIVGDDKYLEARHRGMAPRLDRHDKLCLHSAGLGFSPGPGRPPLQFSAPLDRHFQALLQSLRQEAD